MKMTKTKITNKKPEFMSEEYDLIGLKNHIYETYLSKLGNNVIDERFGAALRSNTSLLTQKVYVKILDKLSDAIADDITSKIIDNSLKDN